MTNDKKNLQCGDAGPRDDLGLGLDGAKLHETSSHYSEWPTT